MANLDRYNSKKLETRDRLYQFLKISFSSFLPFFFFFFFFFFFLINYFACNLLMTWPVIENKTVKYTYMHMCNNIRISARDLDTYNTCAV